MVLFGDHLAGPAELGREVAQLGQSIAHRQHGFRVVDVHARLELQKPNLVAARTEYEELLRTARAKNQTPNTETLKGMADVDVASGQPAAALVLLEEAITNQQKTKGGVSPNLFAAVGEARRRMADPAACRAAYDEAINAASQDIGSYSKREFRRAQKNCDQAKP